MKKLYRIKHNCFIGFSNYSAGQVVFLDESLASNSLTELIDPKTDKSVTSYDNKMINSGDKKVKIKKPRKLFKRKK
jgi:hypothetical protein